MGVIDLIFPKSCLNCDKEGGYICSSCLENVTWSKPMCPMCTKPSIDGFTHSVCRRSLGLDGLIAPWKYEGVIRKVILALKYKFAYEIVSELSSLFVSYLKNHNSVFNIHNSIVLVPIPLHWYRENWRGFNQSEKIGELVAEKMNWKFIPDLLIRRMVTIPQTELDREERLKNVRGIFSFNSNYTLFPNPHTLILFDDVWTTGSTLKEACKVLKRNGAKNMWGMTIAR